MRLNKKKCHQPAAVKTEGKFRARVLSDRIAVVTPLSDQPVKISLIQAKKEGTEQPKEQVITTSNTYIILPDVRFRILPQGGNFHMAVLLLESPEDQ